ncbi:hypothetical protein HanXRQr2_Chr10g0448571 [Helianthus annuus]|uniref:Uncharacterized protein n=1 Tax=Helianthus annuus TaxID=4232 RepID=A0A9K3HYZ0_HELAN|nr:hypothetical protein HanXRQr2_Chr10g0448571 [Helianthus annuus]KAJ0445604.1 hypothetical protein HanIR_Chr16g0844801 [Helianthus annuus]
MEEYLINPKAGFLYPWRAKGGFITSPEVLEFLELCRCLYEEYLVVYDVKAEMGEMRKFAGRPSSF